MSRHCGRGCVIITKHATACARDNELDDALRCKGCLPVAAEDGALLCSKCLARMRSALNDAPDLCALIRSMVDPLGAQKFDQTYAPRAPFAPAPVRADLIDAGNDVLKILIWWANYYGDETGYSNFKEGFPAGTRPEDAHTVAKWAADYLLLNMHTIQNDAWVVMLSRKVLDWPDDWGEWTIHKALSRFPLYPTQHWAHMPCPACHMRAVRVTPRPGGSADFECNGCHWVPPSAEHDSWADYLEGVVL